MILSRCQKESSDNQEVKFLQSDIIQIIDNKKEFNH